MSSGPVEASKHDAIAAITAAVVQPPDPAAAICGHRGCLDHPGKILRSRIDSSYADFDLPGAVALIQTAQRCYWVNNDPPRGLRVITRDGSVLTFTDASPEGTVVEIAE